MAQLCDNTSAGVIVRDPQGRVLLIERRNFPVGIAPPAGHVDDHGSFGQAAADEVAEETGVIVGVEDMSETAIKNRDVPNVCRRQGGTHHVWNVYKTEVDDTALHADPAETKGAGWYTTNELQAFADRTRAYQAGTVNKNDWEAKPGLEPVWLDFLLELGLVA